VALQSNSDVGRFLVDRTQLDTNTHTHKHTHTHTPGRTPLNEWSARRRGRHIHNTQQIQETDIRVLSGIRTFESSNQVSSNLRLRPHDHRDRL